MGLLDGKVSIVTGAGGGLGRTHALALAREGARVVINDLGGTRDGSGAGSAMADAVVAEIRELGGQAVPSYASVATREGAESIVRTAIEAFGQLDILVNNAGILRDRTLLRMTDDEFDIVLAVHARGTYLCTQVAAAHMKDSGRGGRIINTSSYAGLIGNFGQSNYAVAKAGIAGFTRVVALELARAGITVNAIAPLAKTRMTEDIAAVPAEITPEQISPFVVFLASDLAADVTGRIFGVHGPQLFEYRMVMTEGATKESGLWTPQEIAEQLPLIASMPHERAPQAEAPGAAATPRDQLAALFKALPKAFKADKAAGWESTLHFEVKGTGDWSLIIKGGECRSADGKVGAPTGTVTIDSAETLLSIAEGKTKPEAAFMAGKMKADNLGELMKFGQFFSMKRAGEAAQEALGKGTVGAAPAPAADPITTIFDNMGLAFVPEKAAGWAATLLFDIKGTGEWTVTVKDGKVDTQKGRHGTPTCTITFDTADTLVGMVSGKLKPEAAFMAGKMKADNMSELMKFGQAFDLKKGAAAAAEKGASAGAPAAAPAKAAPEGLNPEAVGKVYRGSAHFVKAEQFRAYAEATEDRNPRYLASDGTAIAPPLFAVRPVMQVVEQCVVDPDVGADLLRLVHGEQDMRFYRPLQPWDLVYPVATFEAIEKKASGELMGVRQRLLVDGDPVADITSTYFIRAARKPEGGAPKAEATAPLAPEQRQYLFEQVQRVADDQPIRYAHASGDLNPIHVDPAVARSAGHPNIILHGLCTMAFAAKAVVDEHLGGDPNRLKRLKGRFSRVVLPGDTLTTRGWLLERQDGVTVLGVETVNQNGQPVFSNGLAEVL